MSTTIMTTKYEVATSIVVFTTAVIVCVFHITVMLGVNRFGD